MKSQEESLSQELFYKMVISNLKSEEITQVRVSYVFIFSSIARNRQFDQSYSPIKEELNDIYSPKSISESQSRNFNIKKMSDDSVNTSKIIL